MVYRIAAIILSLFAVAGCTKIDPSVASLPSIAPVIPADIAKPTPGARLSQGTAPTGESTNFRVRGSILTEPSDQPVETAHFRVSGKVAP